MSSAARALRLPGRSAVESDASNRARACTSRTLGRRCNGGVHMRRRARCVRAHGRGLRRSRSRDRAHRWLGLQRRSHSTTQSIGRCCRGRSRTSDEPALPGSAHAHGALGVPRRAAGGSRSGPFSRSDPIRTIPIVTHAHASGGGRPGAIQLRTSLHPAWAAERAQPNEHTAHQAERPAHRPARAALCYSHVRGPGRALTVGIRWVRGHFFVRTADWCR